MPVKTRSRTAANVSLGIQDSLSELETRRNKRQKIERDISLDMNVDDDQAADTGMDDFIELHDSLADPVAQQNLPSQRVQNGVSALRSSGPDVAALAAKNANLKGRKRFNADLEDMKVACETGFVAHGYKLNKIRAGDDEGCLEVFIRTEAGAHVLSASIMISDTSDYPKNHTYLSYSLDSDLASNIQDIVEGIAALPAKPIAETINKVLYNLNKSLSMTSATQSDDEDLEDEDEDEEVNAYYDEDDDNIFVSLSNAGPRLQLGRMQSDFIDVVASTYRPGLIRFGGDDFSISVSLSVIQLADSIPARALMAWDRRLLSRSQHLVLLISGFRSTYPPSLESSKITFKVGLSGSYKPSKDHAREACRNFGLITMDAEDQLRIAREKAEAEAAVLGDVDDEDDETDFFAVNTIPRAEEEEEDRGDDEERFDEFSLSSSLESLMDQAFMKLVQIRRRHKLGWAGAEVVLSEMGKSQLREEVVLQSNKAEILAADKEERDLMTTNTLPHDPLQGLEEDSDINLPLTAFSYLIRRLTLCTRFCIVCHNKLNNNFEALKPYVCDSKLCSYQYYSLNLGPSLEYEIIHNPQTVDLLVSIAYSAAIEGVLDEPLPIGMGLRVPLPDTSRVSSQPLRHPGLPMLAMPVPDPTHPVPSVTQRKPKVAKDGLCEFDELDIMQMRASVAQLIDTLPAIDDMKKFLERKVKPGKSKPKLKEMDPNVLAAAWQILRWCVGSCTAYLEQITSPEESVKNIDPTWKQFRFSVGAPDAEAKFKTAVSQAQKESKNALTYPSLYAFHGSPLRNWHSIVRHGLWYKAIANGRAYGNGVYLAKEGSLSMGTYAQASMAIWRKSKVNPTSCVALVEAVNLPQKFVSSNPYFVVGNTHWLVCRYLLVKSAVRDSDDPAASAPQQSNSNVQVPFVSLDPKHPVTLNNKHIRIPDPTFQLKSLLEKRMAEVVEELPDAEDQDVFDYVEETNKGKEKEVITIDDSDDDMDVDMGGAYSRTSQKAPHNTTISSSTTKKTPSRPVDDWNHDPEYVRRSIEHILPPPTFASPSATMAVQKELKAVLKEQNSCRSFKELGWYLPEEFMGDNLFQWIVEMHSFDETLPIARDLKKKQLNSLIFEIRFPPDYPLSPPFFRIITPRFLPFIHGGGGHVTGGGSICMDLLTSSGWLPSYNIASVLLQIKLAISNLDPRPARLASNWNMPYQVNEALEGYRRAAATHGWQVPVGIDKLVK